MVVRRTKKVRRQRGSRSHGWGVQKDHKGKGMSGGKGNAGVTQHNWIRTIIISKEARVKPTGKFGFKRPQEYIQKYSIINVSHLNEAIDALVREEKAELKNGVYTINLEEIGVTKLLAQGNVTKKMNITVEKASERAISKIKEVGGKVTLLSEE